MLGMLSNTTTEWVVVVMRERTVVVKAAQLVERIVFTVRFNTFTGFTNLVTTFIIMKVAVAKVCWAKNINKV